MKQLGLIASNALGIEAASFFREDEGEAEKDIAESPTAQLEAEPERPEKNSGFEDLRISGFFSITPNSSFLIN